MIPLKRPDKTASLLLLLLLLLSVSALRGLLSDCGIHSLPCREPVYVEVRGDVARPGIHAFCREPSRSEVIAAAEGSAILKTGAISFPDSSLPNGARAVVIREGETTRFIQGEMNGFYKMTLGIPLSINRESSAGLTALPGVGAGLAGAIVRERERRGGFKSLEELTSVRGVGKGLFRRIRPFVKLS
ncbi:MAG: helix-hairpin-helix domain-containing protein [Deltaproteobacteria bacterium]|nr:helix-hairpin-helix domain-containing protein [Deltaproteobacteria bacterium]